MNLFAFAVFAMHPLGALLILASAALFGAKALTLVKWILAVLPVLFGTTVAYPGYGSHLASGGTTGASYTNIGQLKKFNFGGLKAEFDDITNLDSPTIFKEWMKTVVDGSDVTFDGVLNPTDTVTQQLLTNISTAGSGALFFWKITTTDSSTFVFTAYVSDFKFGAEYNKAITFSGSLKIVGNITATWS
jgi:predicted secreted protein